MPIGGLFGFLERFWLTRLARRPRVGEASGLLLVAAGGLGDTVLFSLVFERFKALAREGEGVTLLLRQDAAKMSFLFGNETRVERVDFGLLRGSSAYRRKIFRRLFEARYRAVISLDHLRHPKLDECLIEACSASETLAMEPRSWPKYDPALGRNRALYTRLFDSGPDLLDKVLRWSRFADWLSGEVQPPPQIRLPGGLLGAPARLAHPTLVLMPFSAVREKQSPPDLYRRMIEALGPGTQVIIAGAPDDLSRNPEFEPLVERSGVEFSDLGFQELVPLLRAARLVVSVDTAGMHLAVALGARTLCLASAAYVGEIVPYADEIKPPNVHFMVHQMDCAGCLGNCIHDAESAMYPCVARLDQGRVVEKAVGLWSEAANEA